MSRPLVSVIVTTRNNHRTLNACLSSIAQQTYEPIELIVVDRDSSDGTKLIARWFTNKVYNCGPERSTQRNFGVSRAAGDYVAIIDSDMELSRHVIQDCMDVVQYRPETKGVIIPEESFGRGFWAKCKRLERSFYVGNDNIEAARFFARETYVALGGYDAQMISGEDWDLSTRVRRLGPIEHIDSYIRHNEGRLQLFSTLRKKFYYARQSRAYIQKNVAGSKLTDNAGPLKRYSLFLSKPGRLLANPFIGVGMLFMKTCEFAFGAVGYVFAPKKGRLHDAARTADPTVL